MPENITQNITKLVEENHPRLRSFVRKRVSNDEDVNDILQDVFYQLANVDVLLNPIANVSAWLYRVARNTIINRHKKQREAELPTYTNDEDDEVLMDFAEVLFNDGTATPEDEYLRALVWEELEAALNELSPEQREVYELTDLEGLSVKQVAEITGVPVNTVLSRKYYATQHLRSRMRELYIELICD